MMKKERGIFAPCPKEGVWLSFLEHSSVFMQNKGSESQRYTQHPCTLCGNWTRCVGYYQLKECQSRMNGKGGGI